MANARPAQPFIYLAPIKGVTDALFRGVLANHFGGFDVAIAPFINPQNQSLFDEKLLRDVLPKNNTTSLPLVPQLLHTRAEPFILLANHLADLGYTHVNWNLGCPVPMIAKKKRGSGLLPYPLEILALLDKIMPNINIELSIKTRLGFHSEEETDVLLPQLNQYPLKEIIIHTRLGKQLYKGQTDPDGFARCQRLTDHSLIYNGDVNDKETYRALVERFPDVDGWMLGRGALANPMLAEQIKGMDSGHRQERIERLRNFHHELFDRYQKRLSGPSHILGRLKLLWFYLIESFPENRRYLKKIQKSSSLEQYSRIIEELFTEQTDKG